MVDGVVARGEGKRGRFLVWMGFNLDMVGALGTGVYPSLLNTSTMREEGVCTTLVNRNR